MTTTLRGVYRRGLVRLLEPVGWPEGARVEVKLSATPEEGDWQHIGLVIIAGLGLAGRWVAEIFQRHGIDYVIVEQNPETVKRQKRLGKKTLLGNIAEESTLIAAGIERADILVLTVPDEQAVLEATRIARQLRPEIYIVARTMYTSSGMTATQLGADAVVQAERAVANRFYELLLHKLHSDADRRCDHSPP